MITVNMLKAGSEPNVVTYAIIIGAFASHNQRKEAALWLQKMVERGIRPNACTWRNVKRLPEEQLEKLRLLVDKFDRIPGHWKICGVGHGGAEKKGRLSRKGNQTGWSGAGDDRGRRTVRGGKDWG